MEVLIQQLALTAIIYWVPFYVFRIIYGKPIKKKWLSFSIIFLYFLIVHVALAYIIYGYIPYGYNYPPVLWMAIDYYYLTAKHPILIPKDKPTTQYTPEEIVTETHVTEKPSVEIQPIKENAFDKIVPSADLKAENNTDNKNTLKQFLSNYTKREKIISAVTLLLLATCCVLSYNIYSLQTSITAYQNKIQKYEKTLERRADYGQLKEKADFYDQHAVIVGEDKYYYHTYDCPSRPERFWIYNTEAAVSRDYHPCPTCNPPKPSN